LEHKTDTAYRPESPLPQRSDGRFQTSVSVVGLEQTS
jgi:hypothetical protein